MRWTAILLLCLTILGCFGSAQRRQGSRARRSWMVARDYDYRRDYRLNGTRLMQTIDIWMGTPYCMGGTSRRCIDCSAFVKNVFKKVNGAKLPRKTADLYKLGRPVLQRDLATGDLVFFRIARNRISHVGIYVGNNRFAHASTTVGVTITSMSDGYFSKFYAGARRLF